jgi:hypothetical protein
MSDHTRVCLFYDIDNIANASFGIEVTFIHPHTHALHTQNYTTQRIIQHTQLY